MRRTSFDAYHFQNLSVRAGRAEIHYQVGGEGPPVVLLHGLSGSTRWWAKNSAELARDFRVYVVDLIGFGRSRGQPFALLETPGLLERWFDSLGLRQVSLVGHSMGGLISAEIAARQPELVERLVLVDAAAVPLGRSLVGSAMRLPIAARFMPLDFLPVLVTDAVRAGPLTLLRAAREIVEADITADLSRIAARTLIVWGEHDAIIPLERGEALHRALPEAEFVVVHGAGHNPMWDRPHVFNRLVARFLKHGDL